MRGLDAPSEQTQEDWRNLADYVDSSDYVDFNESSGQANSDICACHGELCSFLVAVQPQKGLTMTRKVTVRRAGRWGISAICLLAVAAAGTSRAAAQGLGRSPGFGFVPRHVEVFGETPRVPREEPLPFSDDAGSVLSRPHSSEPFIEEPSYGEDFEMSDEGWYAGDDPSYSLSEMLGMGDDVSLEVPWTNLQLFAGTQAFTGPTNLGSTGSFGFHEGFNLGAPIGWGPLCEIGWQLGVRAAQSNLSGSEFTLDDRNQIFVTAGFFHRVDRGLQWGIAADWLNEAWYYDADMTQIRGELSWRAACNHEAGFAAVGGTKTKSATGPIPGTDSVMIHNWQPTDWYGFFYRRRFGDCENSSARLLAGWTGESDALLAGDFQLAMSAQLTLAVNATVLVPQQAPGTGFAAGHYQESWNLGISLVWTPWCHGTTGYYAPLLNVADNGSFLVDRR